MDETSTITSLTFAYLIALSIIFIYIGGLLIDYYDETGDRIARASGNSVTFAGGTLIIGMFLTSLLDENTRNYMRSVKKF